MASEEVGLKAKDEVSAGAAQGGGAAAALSPAPLTKEHLSQHDSASGISSDAARDQRAQRATANSPMRSPMISEMKRINALNLEPASNAKASASRNASNNAQGNDLKMEFQRSAAEIRQRQDNARQKQEKSEAGKATDGDKRGGQPPAAQGGGDNPRKNDAKLTNKSFNPAAAAFNPNASVFTPGGNAAPAAPAQAPVAPKQTPPQAQMCPKTPSTLSNFLTYASTPEYQGRTLERILDLCFGQCDGEHLPGHTPDWPEAQGASYHEVLGQPKNSAPMPHAQQMQGPQGGQMPGPGGPWQQQQFGMAQGPGGQAPMGYPQMCPQMQQRPQNAGGGGAPPQQGPGQGPNQGMMNFQPQMMQGGQGMMPAGMVGPGGQPMWQMGMNPGQFGGQGGQAMMVPMMMPAGQHPGQQGMMMGMHGQQGQPGQPGQPGPQGGGPQQGQMMPQMYRQQMGPGGQQAPNDRS